MTSRQRDDTAWRNRATTVLLVVGAALGLVIVVLLAGGVLLYFAALAPVLLINYLLWGRSLSREVAAERVFAEVHDKIANLEVEHDRHIETRVSSNQSEVSITRGIEPATGIVPGHYSGA
jgi:hypothetical protein